MSNIRQIKWENLETLLYIVNEADAKRVKETINQVS